MATGVRRATAADAKIVRDLTRAAYANWIPLIGREPKPMTANYKQAVVDHIIDLYEENDVPVALIEVIPQAGYLLIENIAVLPSQHGKGLGDLLLNHAENIARSLMSNIEFYARRGFREFRREPFPAGGVKVHMKKMI